MVMQRIIGTAIGKSVRTVTRLRRGAGQALPGLVIERMFPRYFASMLKQLPNGVVIITGTNGKTTTTKMVVELLRANGLRVLTNPTGSNLTRGINSTLITQARLSGHLPFDIAVLELDEAYARIFAAQVQPRWVLALNVTRDQLDRFGEVDTASAMIADTMRHARNGIVTNADDPRLLLASRSEDMPAATYFGVSSGLRQFFPSDNELVAVSKKTPANTSVTPLVSLSNFRGQEVTYEFSSGQSLTVKLELSGQHNFQNAAAALSLVCKLLPEADPKLLVEQLSRIKPAFGRGEIYRLKNGSTLRIVLVKNPSGFRQSLASYLPSGNPIMIAINDNIADGRDMSWLWDVDFASLRSENVHTVTGKRATDMALRLHYDTITVKHIEPDLDTALADFCTLKGDKLLFTTYTAMLRLYRTLEEKAGKSL